MQVDIFWVILLTVDNWNKKVGNAHTSSFSEELFLYFKAGTLYSIGVSSNTMF